MMRTILNAWTIFAGLAAVALGVWISVGNLMVGVVMIVSGLLLVGLGVFLVQEGTRRRYVAQPGSAVGRAFPVPSRSIHRDALLNRRKVA